VTGDPSFDAKVEALLFSSEGPLPVRRLADLAAGAKGEVLEAIDRLNVHYGETNRAFRIAEIAGGYQMVTTPEFAGVLSELHRESISTRLSQAALETLSIIAFRQPVTRAEIDRIRGVSASDGVLRHLLERKVVRIAGRAEAPGRPLLYGTTREFLGYFGLPSLSDLPRRDELEAMLRSEPAAIPGDAPHDPATPGERPSSDLESHSAEESDDREGIPAP
jgi:segregation and condensation protein B